MFYPEPFYISGALSRTHQPGSTENPFILQWFYLEPTQGVLSTLFIFQGFQQSLKNSFFHKRFWTNDCEQNLSPSGRTFLEPAFLRVQLSHSAFQTFSWCFHLIQHAGNSATQQTSFLRQKHDCHAVVTGQKSGRQCSDNIPVTIR